MRCAGVVLVRQRPGSAKGVVFMTLEDETGIANIVVWPKVMEKYRKEVMGARLILVEGYIQSSPEEVTHLVAQRLTDRSHDLIGLANDALASNPRCLPVRPWSSRYMTTAASIQTTPRRKSATPATSASCRRHGIFIESRQCNTLVEAASDDLAGVPGNPIHADVDGKTVQYRLSRPPVTPVLP